MKRPRGFMAMDVWQTILERYVMPFKDRNLHCPPTIIPHKDGEGLLNKRMPEMLRMVDQSLKIDIYSHGLLLPKWRERGQDFIEFLGTLPNKVRLLISFHFWNHDGSPNDYGDTSALLRNVLYHKRVPPNVELIFVSHLVRPMTKEKLDEWKRSWDGLGVTVHANASLNPWTGRIEEPGTVEFHGCPYGDFGHWFFGVTGNIVACCMDLEEEIVFGNVMTDDPDAMFAKCDEFYAAQRRMELQHPVCTNCFGLGKRQDLVQIGVMA